MHASIDTSRASGTVRESLAGLGVLAALLALVPSHCVLAQDRVPNSLPQMTLQPAATEQQDPSIFQNTFQSGAGEATAAEKIEALEKAGIFTNQENTPTLDESMTRAQFAKIMADIVNKGGSGEGTFADVVGMENQAWAAGVINAVVIESFSPVGAIKDHSLDEWLAAVVGMGKGFTDEQLAVLMKVNEAIQQIRNEQTANEIVANGIIANSISELSGFPYSSAGALTPRADWPTALNATYNGRVSGSFSDNTQVTGSITMNVDFANISSHTPNIPGSITFDNGKGGASFNLVQMGGDVGGGMSSGSYNGQAMTQGYIKDGQFFGPAAKEIAGKWEMETAVTSGAGKFAGKR